MKKLFTILLLFVGFVQSAYAQEPYAVLSEDGKTLTFYYDNNKAAKNGMGVGPFAFVWNSEIENYEFNSTWDEHKYQISKVVFDASFSKCSSVTSTAYWFYGFGNLTDIEGIENLNTANVTDMRWMFHECTSLANLDLSNFNTAKVIDMESMFADCLKLATLDLSNFNTGNVKSMRSMFCRCSGLTNLDLSNFNTANVTDMQLMFSKCSGLKNLNVSNFNTANVTTMYWMFEDCSGLTSLDVSKFNTANVESMDGMFMGCSGLTNLDVSRFNTANVTGKFGMGYMFNGCSSLTSLDVSNFNTEKVTNLECMFWDCSSLTSLDVSNFNTANVTRMSFMFNGCSKLSTIYCNDTWNCEQSIWMFKDCEALKGAISYDSDKIDSHDSDMINATCANPTTGYFTAVTKGDANADNKITDEDVEVVANRLMLDKTDKFVFVGADSNGDKEVNVIDIVDIINKKK